MHGLSRAFSFMYVVSLPLELAIGRTAARDHISPESTPKYDTSAMDGFAIRSAATVNASTKAPVCFQIVGTVAAGDGPDQIPKHLHQHQDHRDSDSISISQPCVEIMTGGIFPPEFDACVKLEDVIFCPHSEEQRLQMILVTNPVALNANKRFSGNDIPKGDVLLKAGETIQLSHILPLASAGLTSVSVSLEPRVGIFSTGKELLERSCAHVDVNGPYLTAATHTAGARGKFLGVIDDEPGELCQRLQDAAAAEGHEGYDVIITSGAVSKGRHDHIRDVLEKMGAEILFHGVAIRPGHPVLFALLAAPSSGRRIAFFGLPGNPGAAAACFRFLVVPYLRTLRGQEREKFIPASLVGVAAEAIKISKCAGKVMDCFKHGVLSALPGGGLCVEVSPEQSPAKLRPYKDVNCWVHFECQLGKVGESGSDIVKCYPISPAINLPAAGEVVTEKPGVHLNPISTILGYTPCSVSQISLVFFRPSMSGGSPAGEIANVKSTRSYVSAGARIALGLEFSSKSFGKSFAAAGTCPFYVVHRRP
ncbi:MoeA, N-terminal and linker domain-containing protein [Cladorrhinum sp. PSN259]|nr:MoeA, N-terminal and linker domain-containing protein [Cladorrhinum sp. PSN259]